MADEVLGRDIENRLAREQRVARLRLLWEHRQFLWKLIGASIILATVIAFLIPRRYDSTARLMPPDSQSGASMALMAALPGRSGAGLGSLAGDLLGIRTTGDLFIGILKSRTMQDRLVDQFHLKTVYGVSNGDNARTELDKRTSITSDRLSGIITLTVRDQDPTRAAGMAEAYIDGLNSLVAALSISSARRERIFLQSRLKEVNQNLEAAEKNFSQFASKNSAIDIPEEGKAMVSAAATLEGQLIAAQSELEGLKEIYTDHNVRVRSVEARVGELRQQLKKMGGQVGSQDSGNESDQPVFPSIRALPLLGVTYADLYRQAKVQEAVFEALTQEYELAKVEEAKEIPSVKVLDVPNIPERKSFPPRLLIICASAFLSLALGVTWTFASDRWATMDAQDPAKVLAGEVLATVNSRLRFFSRNGSNPHGEAPVPDDRREETNIGASKSSLRP